MKSYILYSLCTALLFTGCKKLIEVNTPPNQLTTDKVFSDTTSATAAMVSTYALFNISLDPNYNKYISSYSDEIAYTESSQTNKEFFQSKVTVANQNNFNTWTFLYTAIYRCNDIITQVNDSKSLPPALVNQLTCESKFLRAYAYFYLVNLYGRVPLLLTTDVNTNARAPQSDIQKVYQQIITDLVDAQAGLSTSYIGPGRVRANKWAATALLAKVYLFQNDWVNALAQTTAVINSGFYTPLQATGNVFLANSTETILSFATINGFITDAPQIIPTTGIPSYAASTSLLKAFEPGDTRQASWLKSTVVRGATYHYPYKYHNRAANTASPEYLIALRTAEQYLIRAEAEANGAGNGVSAAINDLNVIRARAGLSNYAGMADKTSVLTAILHERQVELFMENGNRFFDMKRSGTINTVLSAIKSTWIATANLLPIPQNEITYNNNLLQNPGY